MKKSHCRHLVRGGHWHPDSPKTSLFYFVLHVCVLTSITQLHFAMLFQIPFSKRENYVVSHLKKFDNFIFVKTG
jgi:hypothetical protein